MTLPSSLFCVTDLTYNRSSIIALSAIVKIEDEARDVWVSDSTDGDLDEYGDDVTIDVYGVAVHMTDSDLIVVAPEQADALRLAWIQWHELQDGLARRAV